MARDYTQQQPIVDTLQHALDEALGSRAPRAGGPSFRPASVEEAAALVAAANGYGGVVRLAPAAADVQPSTTEVFLDLSDLSAVRALDSTSGLICIESGAVVPDVDRALAAEGLELAPGHFAPDSTVGAALARGEGLPLAMSVGAILADGTVFETPLAPRRATGPDPVSLLVGARGATGIIVWATLRVQPIPSRSQWLVYEGAASKLAQGLRDLYVARGFGGPALLSKRSRGKALLAVRPRDDRSATNAEEVLGTVGAARADAEPPAPPRGRARRLGWRRIFELCKGQGRRGLFLGPTDLHGGYVRAPKDSAVADERLDALAAAMDPHGTLKLEER